MKTIITLKNIIKKGLFLLLILFSFTKGYSQEFPKPSNPPVLVNDFVGILTQQEKNSIEQKLDNYARTSTTRICIVVVDDLKGYEKADYATRLAQQWGIGQKGSNNGILVLIKPTGEKGKKEIYIAVGYGLEPVITDASTRKIIEEEMIPYFKRNAFYEGIEKGTSTLMSLASKEFSEKEYVKRKAKEKSPFIYLIPFIIIFLVLFIAKKSNNRGMTMGRNGGDIPFWMSMFFFSSMFGGGGRGNWNDFNSGGGDFGGDSDFGGFGGGDFGGGGAGGSW